MLNLGSPNAPIGSPARKIVSRYFHWRMPPRDAFAARHPDLAAAVAEALSAALNQAAQPQDLRRSQ
jgi:hypothetical protein